MKQIYGKHLSNKEIWDFLEDRDSAENVLQMYKSII